MSSMNLFCCLLGAAVIFLFACSDSSTNPDNTLSLQDTVWMLDTFKMNGEEPEKVPENQVYWINFLSDTTVAEIRADCNTGKVTYIVSDGPVDGGISIELIYITEVGCGPESIHGWFLIGLLDASYYRITDNELSIYNEDEPEKLNFIPKP